MCVLMTFVLQVTTAKPQASVVGTRQSHSYSTRLLLMNKSLLQGIPGVKEV